MAIEIITDADSGTSTVGDTAVNLAGNYAATVLGATFQWCAGFFGAYTAFTRIVTGVTIDIQAPISINIFGGFRFVLQGGAVYTVSKIKELNAKADVMTKITNLEELTSSQTQIIDTSTQTITELTQKVDKKISNYDVEEKNGDTSTEEWAFSKSIKSPSYDLDCQEIALITVNDASIRVDTGGTYINGKIIDLGN